MANQIEFNNLTITDMMTQLDKRGISGATANLVAAGWILENIGRTKRTFNYSESFPSAVPACMPAPFARQFQHANWVDGEDLVQAGDANGKEGFNSRFHKIEGDLDQLGQDIHTIAECMAEMRASLAQMLQEVRAELNYINGQMTGPSTGPIIDPLPWTPPKYTLENPKYLGTQKLQGKDVMMFQTLEGIVTLPAVDPITADAGTGNRATWPGALVKFMQEDAAFKTAFPANSQITVDKLVSTVGAKEVMPGVTVADVVQVLPPQQTYANANAFSTDLTDRTALSLHFTNDAGSALSSLVAPEASAATDVTAAPLTDLTFVTKETQVTLEKNGIKDATTLAATDPVKLNVMLQKDGITQSVGDTAKLVVNAGMISRLKTRRQL